jgi:hypothetical protein
MFQEGCADRSGQQMEIQSFNAPKCAICGKDRKKRSPIVALCLEIGVDARHTAPLEFCNGKSIHEITRKVLN